MIINTKRFIGLLLLIYIAIAFLSTIGWAKTDAHQAGHQSMSPGTTKAQSQPESDQSKSILTTQTANDASAKQGETSTAKNRSGAPVRIGDKTLFHVLERVYSFSPDDRAKAIEQKLKRISRDPISKIKTIHIVDAETTTEIVYGEIVIMTITEADAKAEGISRKQLAEKDLRLIQSAVIELHQKYSFKTILSGVLWSIFATAVLVLILKLMNSVFPKLYRKLNSWRGTRIRSLRIQKVELLPSGRITDSLIRFAKILRFVLVLVLFYFYLPLVFSFFPWTSGYASILFSYVLYPLGFVGTAIRSYLPKLFFVAVICIFSFYIIKFVKFIFAEISRGRITIPNFYRDWAEPTFKIIRFLIIAFTVVVVFPYLPGSKSPAFQGISIFLGVLFSLGSTSAVSNIVAGTVLTYTRAFQIGDRVKVGETTGDVVEKTLLVTRIRTIKNVDIAIPNSIVLSSHIVNFSSCALQQGLILHTSVTIGYDAPWRKVHQLLIAAAQATESILKDPKPFVLQTSLNDFYVTYELNAYTNKSSLMAITYSQLHENIQDHFNQAGVEIMSPHYDSLRDGNRTTIPGDYLAADYSPDPFRIQSTPNSSPEKE